MGNGKKGNGNLGHHLGKTGNGKFGNQFTVNGIPLNHSLIRSSLSLLVSSRKIANVSSK